MQSLNANDQTIVLGEFAERRNLKRQFSPPELLEIFDNFRIPLPSNIHSNLARLRKQGLLMPVASGGWALTTQGKNRSSYLIGDFDYRQVEAALAVTPGAELAHVLQSLVSPVFAPPRWQVGILRLLDRFPFETNVFCMTRFPNNEDDPLVNTISTIRNSLRDHGFTLHLASDRQIEDDLLGNVGAYMWACKFGIGILENFANSTSQLNYNVLIELGSMLVTGRRCAILKDLKSPGPPSDLSGQIYKSVDLRDLTQIAAAVHLWASEDLAVGRCPNCP